MFNTNLIKSDRAQSIIIFALVMPIVALFGGMAIDAGILYVTKAQLSTAVDAACLTATINLGQGQTTAAALATNIFDANFGPNPPTPTITFPIDASGNQQVKVTATVYVHTLFMQDLSQWTTVPVSDTAESTRGKLIMSIVLDRSGSMGSDGGETALKSAVPTFVGDFNNTTDEVGMISFSDNATVDFSINYNFITPIKNAVAAMNPAGGTFGTGAGTQTILSNTIGAPLSLAGLQNDSVTVPTGQNVVKVIVYFTDGLMNTVQDNFYCKGRGGSGSTLINYGGYDSTTEVDFFDPTSATIDWCPNEGYGTCESGGPIFTTGFPYNAANNLCRDINGNLVTTFTPQQPGKCADSSSPPCAFSRTNVTSEAQYRALQTVIALRTESPIPTFIFTIGLGSGVSTTTQAFLAQLANDPSYPSTYISGQPSGLFFYIPNCPSSTCTADVNKAFQTIASKVLLRLTQ